MKTNIKPSGILKYSITIIATIIIIAIAGFFTFGFNKSIDFGNAHQVEVSYINEMDSSLVKTKTVDVLKEYNINVRKIKHEDRGFYKTLVFIFKAESLDNAEEIKSSIIDSVYEETEVLSPETMVSFKSVGTSMPANFVWFLILAITVLTIILFLFAWIRTSIFAGVSQALLVAGSYLLGLSLILFTRVEFSVATLLGLFITNVLAVIISIVIFNGYRELLDNQKDKSKITSDLIIEILTENKRGFIIITCIVASIIAISLLTLNLDFIFTALSVLIGFVSSFAILLLISLPLFAQLTQNKIEKERALLSRNQSNKPIETKTSAKKRK